MDAEDLHALETYFEGRADARSLFDALHALVEAAGPSSMRVTRSQVAFRRKKTFAWAWRPGRYLRGRVAPLVLTVCLPYRDLSPRWKEVVEPYPGRFMHHLELHALKQLDTQVRVWLSTAYERAG